MIRKPEEGFEYFPDVGDIFLEAGSKIGKELNGIFFEPDELYHQVIRKVAVVPKETNPESEEAILAADTKKQYYRIKPTLLSSDKDNTIYCVVMKPNDDTSAEGYISFSFGNAKTNGTKYTLVTQYEETTIGGKTYDNPPAITWARESGQPTADSTATWTFNASCKSGRKNRR